MPLERLGLGLFALALVAAGLALSSARRRTPESPPSIPGDAATSIVVGDAAAAGVAESSEELRPPPLRAPGAERRATPPDIGEPRVLGVPTAPDLVRVHGRVVRGGLGVESCSVSFRAARDGDGEEADWDLTDPDGRFAVRLEPGRYLVASEDEADVAWAEEILVPSGSADLELDVRLP